MTNREMMQQLVQTGKSPYIPFWILGFDGRETLYKLIPNELINDVFDRYPLEQGEYGFGAMGAEAIDKSIRLRQYVHSCALSIGNGAGISFAHGGPGEFNKKIIERSKGSFRVEYETGAKKLINFHPHFTHIYESPINCKEDLEHWVLPDPNDPARYVGFAQDVAYAKACGEWTVGGVNGIFSACHYFAMDYQEFLISLITEPELCYALLEKIGQWTVDAADQMCKAGVDCIGFCDDLGSGTSMLISPDLYRKFIKPWHKKLCDVVHANGKVVHMHSHGAIMPVLEDIREIGVDILNPLDPDDGMPFDEVKAVLKDDVITCGGMNKHFWEWDRDTKYKFLKETFQKGREYGSYILMDNCGIPENVSKEQFEEFLQMYVELR